MSLSLFDLHCDTASKMLSHAQPLSENSFAVSLDKAGGFAHYIQVMALFTPPALSDEDGWEHMLQMWKNLCTDAAIKSGRARIASGISEPFDNSPLLLLSLEDARILCRKLSRVDSLYQMGIRIITPLWKGVSCIGGAHDTDIGLSDFGIHAMQRALSLGMIPDISHASERSAEEIFKLASEASRPVIASHSNAYALCPVSRNLRDGQIRKILDAHGVIGINLYPRFLRQDGNASVDDVLRHIDYFLERDARDAICLGCDMDGADLPDGLSDLSMLWRLAEEMKKRNSTDDLIHAIFFENAYRFAKQYLN